jgi:hypothetical protein
VDGTLKEATGHVVDSRGESSRRNRRERSRNGDRRTEIASTGMNANGSIGVKLATRRQAEGSGGSSNREIEGESAAVQRISAKRDNRIEVAKHRETKNSIHSNVGAQSKGKGDRRTRVIDVGSVVSDDGSKIAVSGGIEINWVANSATQLDRFERIIVIKRNKFCDKVWSLGH